MRNVLSLFILLTFCAATASTALAQAHTPVMWTVKSAPHSAVKPGNKFEVAVSGIVEPGWHLYAMQEPDGGPIATQVGLAEGDPADLLRVSGSKPLIVHDNAFHLDTPVYLTTAEFTLHLQAAASASSKPIHILVRYQACNNNLCLPPRTQNIEVPVHIGW
jgi:DsbC/DsbD-like thiol-disulfide interchange protein